MVRGGSWNNNRENARASYRNRNHPNNRNNNLGFRVVCSSHVSSASSSARCHSALLRACRARSAGIGSLPGLFADHGLRALAREERWRGRVPSARLGRTAQPSGA
ncbi:MAG: hypothetical protein JNM48_02550 [Rhodospirillales bacterium]|nr:hypothetical protein [Rhodospirillales bacterium]